MATLVVVLIVVIAMLLSSGLTAWIIWKFSSNKNDTSKPFFLPEGKATDSGSKSIVNSPAREMRILEEMYKKETRGELDNADI